MENAAEISSVIAIRHALETSWPALDSRNEVGKIEGQLSIQAQLLWVHLTRESVKEQLMNPVLDTVEKHCYFKHFQLIPGNSAAREPPAFILITIN